MKRRIYIQLLSALAVIMLVAGCSKKLDEFNPSGLTATTVYTTSKGFETLVNAAYSFTRFWYGKEEGYSLSEMGTDIWTSGTGDVYPQLSQYNNLQGSNTAALNLQWNNFYAALNLCNTGITGVSKVTDYSDVEKNTREAELRFLRAFYRWHLVETFGPIHFTNTPTEGVITVANKTSVDTVYKYILEDLHFACSDSP